MPANGLFGYPKGYGPSASAQPMQLIANVSGTQVASFNIYNCFTPQYDNYRVIGSLTSWSANGNVIGLRFINSDGVYSATNYDYATIYSSSTGGNFSLFSGLAQTLMRLGYPYATNGIANFALDVIGPAREERTLTRSQIIAKGTGASEWTREWDYGATRVTNRFSGLQFCNSGSTLMSGRLSIYGYPNS